MKARTYEVTLIGETPLLMRQDSISWAGAMERWRLQPANKQNSIAGDDRTPAWRWIGNIYVDNGKVCIPADNLMTVLREGGKRCPTGKGQGTFKSQTQSGIVVDQSSWPLLVDGNTIDYAPIEALINDEDFTHHEEVAKKLGFVLFIKRARIGASKHIRVRPRFDRWSVQGSLTVFDEKITTDVLVNIITFAGAYSGIGDWRPSAPKSPGPFGKFTATVKAA